MKQMKTAGGGDHGRVVRAEGDGRDIDGKGRALAQEGAEAGIGGDASGEQHRLHALSLSRSDRFGHQDIGNGLLKGGG